MRPPGQPLAGNVITSQKWLRIHHKRRECLACCDVCDFERAMLTWPPSRQTHSGRPDFLPVVRVTVSLPAAESGGRFLLRCCTSLWKSLANKSLFFPPNLGPLQRQPLSTVGKPNYCRQLLRQSKLNRTQFRRRSPSRQFIRPQLQTVKMEPYSNNTQRKTKQWVMACSFGTSHSSCGWYSNRKKLPCCGIGLKCYSLHSNHTTVATEMDFNRRMSLFCRWSWSSPSCTTITSAASPRAHCGGECSPHYTSSNIQAMGRLWALPAGQN